MSALDDVFGTRTESEYIITPRRTNFPKAEVGTRDYLDDMLSSVRAEKHEEDYLPDPLTKERWTAQARKLFLGHGYKAGFIAWALPFHMQQFSRQGMTPMVTGPMSLEYLWNQYGQVSGPGYGGWVSTEED